MHSKRYGVAGSSYDDALSLRLAVGIMLFGIMVGAVVPWTIAPFIPVSSESGVFLWSCIIVGGAALLFSSISLMRRLIRYLRG